MGFQKRLESKQPSMLNPLGFRAATQRAVVVEVETWAWQQRMNSVGSPPI